MENLVAMAAVLVAFFVSKRKFIPLVILIYYALVMAVIFEYGNGILSIYEPITMSKSEAAEWYTIHTAISFLVMVLLFLAIKSNSIKSKGHGLVLFYCIVIGLSSIYDTAGLLFSHLSMDWYSAVYLLHQEFAVQLDVVVAWMASDNAISRKIYRAFEYDAGKTDHEHGAQNRSSRGKTGIDRGKC